MKLHVGAFAVSLAVLLSACSAAVTRQSKTPDATAFPGQENQLYTDLQIWLPGFYSNYAQVIEAGGAQDSVLDLNIRRLPTDNQPVFLFESQQRGSGVVNHDLYFVKLNSEWEQPELHFARLTGSDLTMSLPEMLDIGWQRVLKGCVIMLAPFNHQKLTSVDHYLLGRSDPKTCRFEDPLHGEIAFERFMSISNQQINMVNTTLKPGEVPEEQPLVTQFQQHSVYAGTVRLSSAITTDSNDSSGWQTSTAFNLYDDGRVSDIYDSEMKNMKYGIRLSRLHWRENQPPYLKLEIIERVSGGTQAYSWFSPESEQIDWELDWVTVHLRELNLSTQ